MNIHRRSTNGWDAAGPGADAECGRLQVQLRGLLGAAGPLLMLFGFVGLVAAAAVFYFRHQPNRHRRWRVVLFVIRAAVLCLVLLLLAEPILTLTIHAASVPPCGCSSTAPTA